MKEVSKNILDIIKIPSSAPFYDSCIPGAVCTTCSQFNGIQRSPPHSSSGHSPLSAVIFASIALGRGPSRLLVQLSQTCEVYFSVSGPSLLPPGKYASVGRKPQHERASLGPCAHGNKGRKSVEINLIELSHLS